MSGFRRGLIANASEINGGYHNVDFLQSDGAAYINTGFVMPEEGAIFDVEFEWNGNASGGSLIGSRLQYGTYNGFLIYNYASGGYYASFISATSTGTNFSVAKDTRYSMKSKYYKTESGYAVEETTSTGLIRSASSAVTYVQDGCPMYLFALNNANAPAYHVTNTRIYKITISDSNGIKIADFTPCVRKADNVPGMWDKVGKRFLTNAASSGTFIYG